jgi:hypothetical protein
LSNVLHVLFDIFHVGSCVAGWSHFSIPLALECDTQLQSNKYV